MTKKPTIGFVTKFGDDRERRIGRYRIRDTKTGQFLGGSNRGSGKPAKSGGSEISNPAKEGGDSSHSSPMTSTKVYRVTDDREPSREVPPSDPREFARYLLEADKIILDELAK